MRGPCDVAVPRSADHAEYYGDHDPEDGERPYAVAVASAQTVLLLHHEQDGSEQSA